MGFRKLATVVMAAVMAVVLLVGVAGVGYLLYKRSEIRRFDLAFAEVRLGDKAEEAFALFGQPHQVRTGEQLWDTANWGADDEHQVVSDLDKRRNSVQFCYRVETFFLPIIWVISCDEKMEVVAKARLD